MSFATALENLRHPLASEPSRHGPLNILLRIESWLDTRASSRALEELDERTLSDIGLTRADVERMHEEASWQHLLLPEARR